jgi:hypothetical protein
MENVRVMNIKNILTLFLVLALAAGLIVGSFVGEFKAEVFICGITVFGTSLVGIGIFILHLVKK